MLQRKSVVRGLMVLVLATVQLAPALAVQPMITAGYYHTCALTTTGGVKCWGEGFYGQLGDNSIFERDLPVDVWALTSGVAAISAGYYQTCALTTATGVKCWGSNGYGELGDNTITSRAIPVDVPGLSSGVASIAAGGFYTCALTTAGGVKCWGHNPDGQLGNNSTTDSHIPVDVSGLTSGVAAIALGHYHTCALTTAGGVKCWGYNSVGELGDNTTTNHLLPVDVSGLASSVVAITLGEYHTCALTAAGGVKCWGDNLDGQLGDNTTTTRHLPVDVAGLTSGVTAIAAGGNHTCAVTTAGGVKCWGRNDKGQLGDNTTTERHLPVDVSGLTNGVTGIALSEYHSCALTATGGVKCWGYNFAGQLGDNTTVIRYAPVVVMGIGVPGETAPDAPTIGTATPGNGQVTVNFTAPANNGGWPILGYTVTTSPGGMTATGSASPITITGLANGRSYVFTVTATNAVGTGAASAASTAVIPPVPVLTFVAGWNLIGNGDDGWIDPNTTFKDATKVSSVWKWVTSGVQRGVNYPTWAFYSPSQSDGGWAYARSKGYESMAFIEGGEGFWVNARAAFSVSLPSGVVVQSSNFMPTVPAKLGGWNALPHGWSLIATGDTPTPAQFDAAIATVESAPPAAGSAGVYTNLTSLWAWDATNQKWYFWAPSLVNSGGLAAYIAANGYSDFATLPTAPTGTLSPTTGFWVNMP